MTIYYDYATEQSFIEDYEELAHTVVCAASEYVHCPYEIHVDISLVDNERIHEMNLEFRQVDRPTDVLSFPMVDYKTPGDFSLCEEHPECYFDAESGELLLGDIVISVEKVYEQAENFGHSPRREFAFLVAHSMLHLFGYDHMEDEERLQMERMQEEILNQLGYTRSMQ